MEVRSANFQMQECNGVEQEIQQLMARFKSGEPNGAAVLQLNRSFDRGFGRNIN